MLFFLRWKLLPPETGDGGDGDEGEESEDDSSLLDQPEVETPKPVAKPVEVPLVAEDEEVDAA